MVDFKLSEDQQLLKASAHEFARDVIRPVSAAHDHSGEFPDAVLKQAWELGLMNTHIGEDLGGLGLSCLDGAILSEELAWGCTGISTAMEANGLAIAPIIVAGNAEQKKKFLGRLVDDHTLACYAVTEPGAGSDVASLRTTAERRGDVMFSTARKCGLPMPVAPTGCSYWRRPTPRPGTVA